MTNLEGVPVGMSQLTASLHRSFNRSWRSLAQRGKCDAFDSMEYRRVLNEWVAAGRPRAVRRFILYRANLTPEEKP